jgi:putative adhesin
MKLKALRQEILKPEYFAVVALCTLAASSARADDWRKQWAVGPQPSVRVDTNDASVDIEAVESAQVEAQVTTKGWSIGDSGVRVIEHQSSNHLDLEVKIPNSNWGWGHGERSVHVKLRVPRQTSTEVRTGDGAIHASHLHGPIRLNTGDGSIEGEDLDGTLDARTGDGHVRVSGRFDAVSLHTNDGSVELDAQRGSKMSSDWRVQTGDGHVTLRLPGDFAANLDAHTGDGHIETNIPISMQGSASENQVQGKINGGGMNLIVRTGDGGVRIDRL